MIAFADPCVDLCFRITGTSVPLDHGYALYSTLSRALPVFHEAGWLGVHPLMGLSAGKTLQLSRGSRLRMRLTGNSRRWRSQGS